MWKIVQRKYGQKVVGTSNAKDSSYHQCEILTIRIS